MRRLTVSINADHSVSRSVEEIPLEALSKDDLLIRVAYSSINYKDALSANGNRGVSRNYPHTPGIDAAGTVVQSRVPEFKEGDQVVVTGYDLGMNTRGGFSEYIAVPASWVIPLPQDLSLKEAMIYGTAGLTAAMAIDKITSCNLKEAPVVISGASGGVGSLSLMILQKLGIETIAITRRLAMIQPLKTLGASEVIHGFETSEKPLLKGQFSAGIDTVGGEVLENMIKHILPNGCMALCGMAASPYFKTSVFPFILRGLTLHGIESAEASSAWRIKLWNKLALEWKPDNLESISRTVKLEGLELEIQKMLAGQAQGRVVVDLQ